MLLMQAGAPLASPLTPNEPYKRVEITMQDPSLTCVCCISVMDAALGTRTSRSPQTARWAGLDGIPRLSTSAKGGSTLAGVNVPFLHPTFPKTVLIPVDPGTGIPSDLDLFRLAISPCRGTNKS